MLRGIYISTTGMVAEMDRQNVIANNLANVDTVGFKRDNVVQQPFAEILLNAYSKRTIRNIGPLGLGVQAVTEYPDFTGGSIVTTDNPYDLAIEGAGFFAVEADNGVKYTRAGNFIVDRDNYLVTKNGYRVLGQNGPIRVEGNFTVGQDGAIIQDGAVVDHLMIFSEVGMVKAGETFYVNDNPQLATEFRVIQGALERSNVNAIREMIQMINVTRTYDTNHRALMAHDETLAKAVNELVR
ncbi:MAG: flagellar hook-basal body protein [Firmicutes bacterium]|nr:flagellar hook-basal body protein [Bacillota bacterium]